jgi:hypothetical protein
VIIPPQRTFEKIYKSKSMIRKVKIFLSCSILLSLFLTDCDNDKSLNCESVPCTAIFKIITITVKHKADSSGYNLTNYKVIRITDSLDLSVTDELFPKNQGLYPVTDDSQRSIFVNKNVEIEFSGYLNDSLVIQKRFIVTSDCCHISLVEGDTKFYI